MLGIVLLIIALVSFFIKKWQYISYFLYIGFLTDGYKIAINPVVGGIKNVDLALVYSCIIIFVLAATHRLKLKPSKINRSFWWFCIFIISSFIFSIVYYNIPFFETLQGGRFILLILCYPILSNMSMDNITKVLRLLAWFTVWMLSLISYRLFFNTQYFPSMQLIETHH